MKQIPFLILGILLFLSCQQQIGKIKVEKVEVNCEKLNDSAMYMLAEQSFANSVKLINFAIECDPNNNVYIRNKGMILANAGLYKGCISHLEKNKKQYTTIERLSTTAECYFQIKDKAMFDSFKKQALINSTQEFNKRRNESTLIIHLTTLKKFDGEYRMLETLKENKSLFNSHDMYFHMIKFLEKIPTLK